MISEQNRRELIENIIESSLYDEDTLEIIIDGISDNDNSIVELSGYALLTMPESLKIQAIPKIAPFITDSNINKRNFAGDLLIKLGENSLDTLIEYLSSDNQDTRKFTCDIIGLIGNKSVENHLIKLIDDDNINVSMSAIEALGNLESKESVEKIISKYDSNATENSNIITALGRIGDKRCVDFIMIKLHDSDEFIKFTAIDALARCSNSKEVCIKLLNMFDGISDILAGILIKTIFAISNRANFNIDFPEKYKKISYRLLDDDDEDIRLAAILSLGNTYSETEIELLSRQLLYSNPSIDTLILYKIMKYNNKKITHLFFENLFAHKKELVIVDVICVCGNFWEEINTDKKVEILEIILGLANQESSELFYELFDFFNNIEKNVFKILEHNLRNQGIEININGIN